MSSPPPSTASTTPTPTASSATEAGRPRLRLHFRIVLPFAVAAIAAMALGAGLTTLAVRAALRARVESQLASAATLLAQSRFALTPAVIGSVRAIAEADVITFDRAGQPVASTMEVGEAARMAAALAPLTAAGVSLVREVPCGAATCFAALEPVNGNPDVFVAVIDRGTELAAATRGVAGMIAGGAVLGLVLLVGVSQVVARGVTAPIERLVAVTQRAGDGDAGLAEEGQDEVGRLGRAFNDMVARLAASRAAQVRGEKLALAGLFAARVAHDIRNPLSSIKMQTQLLQQRFRDSGDERTVASLAAVAGDIAQVESVVRDLLDVARPDGVRRAPGDLNALVGRCLDQVAPRLAYRNIRCDAVLDPAVPGMALDAGRLQQAILNVINNASDAMTAGGCLTVRTALGPGEVTITVADDGPGVAPEVLARVFDPFFTTKPDGVGLGLMNAKSVVEQHGGRIVLEPALPHGTRVTMTVPLASGDPHDG